MPERMMALTVRSFESLLLGKTMNEIIPLVMVQSSGKWWIDDSLAFLNFTTRG